MSKYFFNLEELYEYGITGVGISISGSIKSASFGFYLKKNI
jgi:hypothetical protein